jgi:nitrate/TMAO reductase-like tetraheme cytochrome c subunit
MVLPSLRRVIFVCALLLAVSVLFALASFEVTSTPKFCGSCHIMKPYYVSWKTSSHKQIPCVDCHIPPGIESELRKKYEALSMVVRYFTGTYGTHPWAEVDDVSCLECHERRLVSGREPFHSVIFDHKPHLTEMRRGKKLRCTSCHSQIVQGSHIAVTTSTCILCHFKDQPAGTGTAQCELCHNVPNITVRKAGMTFNHSDVAKFDMKCDSCHAGIISGKGEVPRNRCLSCHNEAARLQRFNETETLHRIHVTDHKVECLDCHNEILHATMKEHMEGGNCATCHSTAHSPQQRLYAGVGGKGSDSVPDPMYLAGVRCEGCHFLPAQWGEERILRASEVSCMSCHGASFNQIYARWQKIANDRLQQAKAIIQRAENQFATQPDKALEEARENIQLIEKARPIHNVNYTLRLLNTSLEGINRTLKEQGKPALDVPWEIPPYQSICMTCHAGVETQSASYKGKPFSHTPHVMKNGIDCEWCHEPHPIPPKQQPRITGLATCADCHHQQMETPALCVKCHDQDIAQPVTVRGTVLDRKGLSFDHAMHLEATGLQCLECHATEGALQRTPPAKACADCHG